MDKEARKEKIKQLMACFRAKMDNRRRLITCCDIRIRRNEGDNIFHNGMSFGEIKMQLEHGCEISEKTLSEIQKNLEKYSQKEDGVKSE